MKQSRNVLFVCSMNKWRSPTAEKIYAKHDSIHTRSCGTSSKSRRTISANDIEWADLIFVMEHKHKKHIKSLFPDETSASTIHVLDIPDEYQFMDPELVVCLRDSVDAFLSNGIP